MSKFWSLLLVPVVASSWALPARAALVNDYSFTDDVWNAPLAPGHWLGDLRAGYTATQAPSLAAPIATLAVGLAPGLEAGVWGAYGWTGFGSVVTGAPGLLNPYLKLQLPVTAGRVGFGLVAGAQLPTRPGLAHDLALEGVAFVPVNAALTLDLGLGLGRDLASQANLGHLNATAYWTLACGPTLVAALFALLDAGTPTYGQQLGVYFPCGGRLTTDLSLTANETGGAAAVTPMLGATVAF